MRMISLFGKIELPIDKYFNTRDLDTVIWCYIGP